MHYQPAKHFMILDRTDHTQTQLIGPVLHQAIIHCNLVITLIVRALIRL